MLAKGSEAARKQEATDTAELTRKAPLSLSTGLPVRRQALGQAPPSNLRRCFHPDSLSVADARCPTQASAWTRMPSEHRKRRDVAARSLHPRSKELRAGATERARGAEIAESFLSPLESELPVVRKTNPFGGLHDEAIPLSTAEPLNVGRFAAISPTEDHL